MQRSSQQQHDAIIWTPASIPLGAVGLDLRQPAAPNSLAKLINARFRDAKTVERRRGYLGNAAQDGSDFPPSPTPITWVYGHGQTVSGQHHFPIAGRGAGTFRFDDADIVWTGDRLLVMRDGETALGSSAHWSRGGEVENKGIPAYLPVQTDSSPPDVISGEYVETCLTTTVRTIVASGTGGSLTAWVLHREKGALINKSVLVASGVGIHNPRVVNSDDQPVAVWRNGSDLYSSWWSGTDWTAPSLIDNAVDAFELHPYNDGFFLLWRASGTVKVGRYSGHSVNVTDFDFGTTLALTTTGAMALAVDENGGFAVVYQDTTDQHLWVTRYNNAAGGAVSLKIVAVAGPWNAGVTACFRTLENDAGNLPLVVHAANSLHTKIVEVDEPTDGVLEVSQTETRYRTHVASKSWAVGDEVFCWLRARNAETNYLVAGVTMPQVCGYADREEAIARVVHDGVLGIPLVTSDPLSATYNFTWIRPYTTGDSYSRPGNVRIGDINFMPELSVAHYGESAYLAGSAVRNYDGVVLGDAGFHDYPEVENNIATETTGGSLTLEGAYQFRVYPVRYNRRGERFMGAALTTDTLTLTGANNAATLNIYTLPDTNHDDVILEVYRTEDGGTTFYYEGYVANSFTAESVSYTSTMSDADLIEQPGDSHAAGVGQLSELEEFGPLGCSMLAVAADRLWGAGGQVPRGWVQFSKLKEPNEGAGFDTIAGFQEIDTQGGEVTSLIGDPEATVIFQRDAFCVLTGPGPNNYGIGSFETPQLRLVDGAINNAGTALTQAGVVYWGEDGPRILLPNYRVENISAPVRPLTKTLTPSGVQVNRARQEVVWFTADGDAVLWNYQSGSRWAQWTGLQVAGCSNDALITTDGRVLIESDDAYGDDGVPFEFAGSSGELSNGSFGADMEVNRVGIAGAFEGPHQLRFRIYYNGSPLWSDSWIWEPDDNTWLALGEDHEELTPAEVDALNPTIRSGAYAFIKKPNRHTCRHFRVEWSDISSLRPTYLPYELSLEVGARPGMGRSSTQTFGA